MCDVTSLASEAPVLLPLLEREAPLELLRAALVDATRGEGRAVLIHGEAGVGKSSLVSRFSQESRDRARVLTGACDPLFTPRPLGPLADVAQTIGGELRRLIETGAIPYRMADVLMEELDEPAPTILVMEDMHWADEATLDVFRLLVRRVAEIPLVLVATYRDDELGARHPLRIVLGGLGSLQSIQRIRLLPLSLDAVARLAEPYAADPGDLYRLTSGNPFFVTEVLAASPNEIPVTVRDAVHARIARLSPFAIALLEAASTIPTGAEPWLLEALAGGLDGSLDECLGSGVLTISTDRIAFRHELARLTVEESLTPDRRTALHRKALAALKAQPAPSLDLARLAHHADAAGDGEAVLALAPAAAARAASLGAHREAAAQYRRVLRYAQNLALAQRAELLARYSHECYLTDEPDEAIASLRSAVDCYRELGDRRNEGATLNRVANILWCPGRGREGRRVGREAVALLEQLPPGPELAYAYDNLAFLHRMDADLGAAREWSDRAVALAESLQDERALRWTRGGADLLAIAAGSRTQAQAFERGIERALDAGHEAQAAEMMLALVLARAHREPFARERRHIHDGLMYSQRYGLDLTHAYFLAFRSRLELDEGRWMDAAESAELVLGERFVSSFPRTLGLVTLALVRARRGDPDVWPLLDEARALAEHTGEIPRIAPVAAARAEAASLAGRPEAVRTETEAALQLALERRAPRAIAELALARRRAGIEDDLPELEPEPYRSQLAGDWRAAAEAWRSLGCPYERALALHDGGDPDALRESLDICAELGARPLASMISRRLRELGISVPRGPRASTQDNPAGLTAREQEVLTLLAEGLRNAEIAQRLVVSRRTIDHHVSAILRKLGSGTRSEAVAEGRRRGLLESR